MNLYFLIASAMLLDLMIGDPRGYYHPVRFVGWLCTTVENHARKIVVMNSLKLSGLLCSSIVILVSVGSAFTVLSLGFAITPGIGIGCAFILIYVSISTGDLVSHSSSVLQALDAKDLESARTRVGMMVGRETDNLDEKSIVRACIESVSENLVDGTTAVLFWAFAASLLSVFSGVSMVFTAPLGAVFYKAVNTLDSMHGYKNEHYREFGWFAARLDDILNFIPARISGFSVIIAAFLIRYDAGCAMRTFWMDRLKSPSPNSAHTEAAVAGALCVRLGGTSSYSGKVIEKPVLGDSLDTVQSNDIGRANRLVVVSSFVFFILCCLVHLLLMKFSP